MKVLVAVASRHGATTELATELGARLREAAVGGQLEVDVRPVETVDQIAEYAAVILGSAVYLGHWLPGARQFATSHAAALAHRPVWFFSSGPVGEPLKPDGAHAVDVGSVLAMVTPVEHRVFAGRIERRELGLGERAVVRALRVPEGDFRDWAAVREWAVEIAETLASGGAALAS